MHAGKCVTCARKCLSLKFLVNSQHKWFGQSKRKGEKNFGVIPLLMNVTIPDTHGTFPQKIDGNKISNLNDKKKI